MATKPRRWTIEDLDQLPDDRNTYELVHGELLVTPAPNPPHDDLVAIISHIIYPYVEEQRLGRVYHPRAVVQTPPHSQVEPDIMVHPGPRRPLEAWAERAMPLLVVEILSKHSRRHDLVTKRGFYVESGIPDYWIVDGDARTITVVRPNVDDVTATETLSWHPTGATEPLVIDLRALFREALG